MEQPTPVSVEKAALEAQIRELYGRVAYTTKTHEKAADIYFSRYTIVKFIQIGLSAITTTTIVITLLGENRASEIVAAIASAILLALNVYLKENDLASQAQKHSSVASELWSVRESYLSLLTDLISENADVAKVRQSRDVLQEKQSTIFTSAPRTFQRAYLNAQKGLKVNEELTFSDREIDMLLPKPLRKEQS